MKRPLSAAPLWPPHVIAGTSHRGGYLSATYQPEPRLCRGTFATTRSVPVTTAPIGRGEVHEHVIAHRLPTVVEYRPQPPMDHRDRLSLEHGRERASTVVFHQRGVGPVRCAQQAPTSQPCHPAQLVIGPGEPVSKVLVVLRRHGGEPSDRDMHVYLLRLDVGLAVPVKTSQCINKALGAHLETLRSACASGSDFDEGFLKKDDLPQRAVAANEHRSGSLAATARCGRSSFLREPSSKSDPDAHADRRVSRWAPNALLMHWLVFTGTARPTSKRRR